MGENSQHALAHRTETLERENENHAGIGAEEPRVENKSEKRSGARSALLREVFKREPKKILAWARSAEMGK
jgi:hypothetical protein